MDENWYRDIVELSQDAIYVWCDGRFVFANRATARLFGFASPQDLIGRRVFDRVHPDFVALAQSRLTKLLADGQSLTPQEFRMIRADGQVIDVESMATRFVYRGRIAAHVILRDIAERKALQRDQLRRVQEESERQRLQHERDHFHQLLEAMPTMAWTASPDGAVDYVNQRTLDYLSLGSGDIEGWGWQRVVHPDDLPECLRRWKRSLATGEAYEAELRVQKNRGDEYRWHLVRGVPVHDSENAILRWVGTTTDIDDQKQARTVLEQSQARLAEAVRLGTQDLLEANAALREEIEERKKVEKALRCSQEELRKLSAHLQSARESERAAVAREIHDELGATLTAAKMDLHWFARLLANGGPPGPEKLAGALELIDSAIQTVKRIATELRPGILDHLGLWPALHWQLQEFELHFGISCRIDPAPAGVKLDKDAQTAVFRIFQEALTNIARHSQATAVDVGLKLIRNRILLKISDNGIGLPPGKLLDPEAFGIQGMRERARTFGGDVKFAQNDGGGTSVLVEFPVRVKPQSRRHRDREAV